MSYKKILCFGSLNPDLIYFVDELPKRGDDIRSSNSLIRAGGTAINCAERLFYGINWFTLEGIV
tara:strand:+ start:2074 stop:2265 length:192 start_codon:yes stop_codon:yes gene_type:complete